jgi:hypothetical protein
MATNPLPSIQVPAILVNRQWNPVWYRWVKPLLQTVKASAAGVLSVTQTLNAALGQWGIQVNDDERVTAAIRLDGGATESSFAILADKFEVVHPSDDGDVKQGFVVGQVDGVSTVGIDGDLVVDDTIVARHIDVEELDAISADSGEITAGKLQRADGAMVVDLDNKALTITNGTVRLKVDGSGSGAVAIYTVPSETSTDDDPFTDPLDHVSRLLFHSALPAPAIIKISGSATTTGTINAGALGANVSQVVKHNLFAHGQDGTPMVFGRLTVGGNTVPMCGSIPIDIGTSSITGLGRWAHLGADETNVIIDIGSISGPSGLGAVTLDWEVYVTDFLLDETPTPTDDKVIRIEADLFTANNGQFDSRRRYLRVANSGEILPMVHGKTIDLNVIDGAGDNDPGHAVRYSVDGYIQQFAPSGETQPSSFNASITQIKF